MASAMSSLSATSRASSDMSATTSTSEDRAAAYVTCRFSQSPLIRFTSSRLTDSRLSSSSSRSTTRGSSVVVVADGSTVDDGGGIVVDGAAVVDPSTTSASGPCLVSTVTTPMLRRAAAPAIAIICRPRRAVSGREASRSASADASTGGAISAKSRRRASSGRSRIVGYPQGVAKAYQPALEVPLDRGAPNPEQVGRFPLGIPVGGVEDDRLALHLGHGFEGR